MLTVGQYINFRVPTAYTIPNNKRRRILSIDNQGRPVVQCAGRTDYTVELTDITSREVTHHEQTATEKTDNP